jgi:hypothetical protein
MAVAVEVDDEFDGEITMAGGWFEAFEHFFFVNFKNILIIFDRIK